MQNQQHSFDNFQDLFNEAEFIERHLGSNAAEQAELLKRWGMKIWIALLMLLYLHLCA